uniref:Uncharacterized protein n=1 Tax=Anopheles maculatus TaxID=74869 RepID=A0A182S6R0_9DIPT
MTPVQFSCRNVLYSESHRIVTSSDNPLHSEQNHPPIDPNLRNATAKRNVQQDRVPEVESRTIVFRFRYQIARIKGTSCSRREPSSASVFHFISQLAHGECFREGFTMFCTSTAMVLLLLQTQVNGKYVYHDQEDPGLLDERYLEALEGLKESHAAAQYHSSVSEKSKTVPVPVFQKVGVPVPHPVPIAVPHYIKVYIPQPYPLQVNVEQPIKIPIYKVIPKVIEKP